MSPPLNGSSALQRFERSNAIEIRNGIMFDFYPGLPHMSIREIDSQVNKQMNAGLQRIRGQLAYMTPEFYLFISVKNMDIQKKIKTRLFFY